MNGEPPEYEPRPVPPRRHVSTQLLASIVFVLAVIFIVWMAFG